MFLWFENLTMTQAKTYFITSSSNRLSFDSAQDDTGKQFVVLPSADGHHDTSKKVWLNPSRFQTFPGFTSNLF